MKMILLTVVLLLTGCSYNHINGYNLLNNNNDNNNLYQEYFIQESISFLKMQRPPARHEIILVPSYDTFSTLLINRFRNIGYSILEIASEEAMTFRVKDNQFLFAFTIDDLIYEDDSYTEFHHISLQLFVNNLIYSRVYRTNYDDGYLQPLGNWSVKELERL